MILLLLFLLSQPNLVHTELLNCSQVLCKDQSNICTSMDICQCDVTNYRALCPSFSTKKITIQHDNYSSDLNFNGFRSDITLPAAMELWKSFLDTPIMANTKLLSFNSFCRLRQSNLTWDVGYELRKQCFAVDSRFRTLNTSDLPILDNLIKLRFIYDCLDAITGDFSKQFPKLLEVDFTDNFLAEIPKSLRKSRTLATMEFNGNIIKKVSRSDFPYPMMTLLHLDRNCIQHLPEDLLQDLVSLDQLSLSNNDISEVPKEFLQHNKLLTNFIISFNRLSQLPTDLFTNNQQLKFISLEHNQLQWLPEALLKTLTKLEKIDLNDNHLVDLPAQLFYSCYGLTTVNLYRNKFTEIPYIRQGTSSSGTPFSIDLSHNNISVLHTPITRKIPKAAALYMSHNCLQRVDYDPTWHSAQDELIKTFHCTYCCVEVISPHMFDGVRDKLDISNNGVGYLDFQALQSLKQFESVDLSYNRITMVNLSEFDSVFPQQGGYGTEFNLAGNPIICDCRMFEVVKMAKYARDRAKYPITFDFGETKCSGPGQNNRLVKEVDENDLFCVYRAECPGGCNCKKKQLENPSFVVVDCSWSNLTTFPVFDENKPVNLHILLGHNRITQLPVKDGNVWKRIVYLDISHNEVQSLDNLTLTTSNLQDIRLDHNLLDTYQPIITKLVTSNRTVTLSGNPWNCDCNTVRMKNTIFNTNDVRDKENMTCKTSDDRTYTFFNIDNFCTVDHTSGQFLIVAILVPVFVVLLISVSACAILFFRYKHEILYWLFSKGICLKFVTEEDVDADKTFDAFVSYSSEDCDWVNEFLVPGLETGHPSYTLCLHDRDWPGGVMITDQIIKSVQLSRRTIIVLTDNFLASVWSRFEFDVAYQQAMKDQVRRLIVVVPDKLPDLSTTDSQFRTFISLTTYLEASKPYFWRKLRSTMPRMVNLIGSKVAA